MKLGQNVPVLFIQEKNKRKTNNQLKLPEAESFPFQGHLRVHVSTACSIAGRFLVFFTTFTRFVNCECVPGMRLNNKLYCTILRNLMKDI